MKNGFIKLVKGFSAKVFKQKAKKEESKIFLKPEDEIKHETEKIIIPEKHRPSLWSNQLAAKKKRKRKIRARLTKRSRNINHKKAA